MSQRLAAHPGHHDYLTGPSLWLIAVGTVVLASSSVLVLLWSPRAFGLALITGLMAIAGRSLFVRVRTTSHRRAEGASAVANTGLALAAVAVAPLLAFALLWAALLAFLGVTWLLNAIGLI